MDGIVYFRYDTINDLFLITRDIIHGRSTAPRGARGLFSDHFAMLSWAWGPMCIFVHQSNSIIFFCFIFWGCLRFHLWNNNTDPTIAWLSQVDAYSCAVLYCDNSPYYFPCLSSRPRIDPRIDTRYQVFMQKICWHTWWYGTVLYLVPGTKVENNGPLFPMN